jgi:glycerate kinase
MGKGKVQAYGMVIFRNEGSRLCAHGMENKKIMYIDTRRTQIKIQKILMVVLIEILLD